MNTDGNKKYTYVQCQECGHIYRIARQYSDEDLYVTAYCVQCESRFGLNLGCNEDDIYYFMNPNLDGRLF